MEAVKKISVTKKINHWLLTISFLVLLFTGIGFAHRIVSWINAFFSSTYFASEIHKWGGVIFGFTLLFSIGSYLVTSLRFGGDDVRDGDRSRKANVPPQGRLSLGQKLFYLTLLVLGLAIVVSGFILWLPNSSRGLLQLGLIVHNVAFMALIVTLPFHVYLVIAANPGTYRIVTHTTAPFKWAKKRYTKRVKKPGVD